MREDLKPLEWPRPPNIAELDDVEAREIVESYLAEIEYITLENQRRGTHVLWRVRLCGFLHGFLSPIQPNTSHHFKWCPAPYWINDWR